MTSVRRRKGETAVSVAGDHLERLTALRDTLTEALETAPPAYLAATARQLQAVLSELAALQPPDDTDALDELIERAGRPRRAIEAAEVSDA